MKYCLYIDSMGGKTPIKLHINKQNEEEEEEERINIHNDRNGIDFQLELDKQTLHQIARKSGTQHRSIQSFIHSFIDSAAKHAYK